MDFNSNQFVIFSISLIILILICFFSHHIIRVVFGINLNWSGASLFHPIYLANAGQVEDRELPIVKIGSMDEKGADGKLERRNEERAIRDSKNSAGVVVNPALNYVSGSGSGSGTGSVNAPGSVGNKKTKSDSVAPDSGEASQGTYQYKPGDLEYSKYYKAANGGDKPVNQIVKDPAPIVNAKTDTNIKPTSNVSKTPSLSTTLPSSSNLGKIRVIDDIDIGDTQIFLDSSKMSLTEKMQIVINNKNFTMSNVKTMNSFFYNFYSVNLDSPSPIFVAKDTYLQVLSPSNSKNTATPNSSLTQTGSKGSSYSTYGTTPSNSLFRSDANGKIIPLQQNFILHLPTPTAYNDIILIYPALNITEDMLKSIAVMINTTNEPFSVMGDSNIEGLDTPTPSGTPTPTPTPTITPTPTSIPSSGKRPVSVNTKLVTCGPLPTRTGATGLSVFYVADCVGYNIKMAFYKFGVLILELDTDATDMLHSGYYKLTI